MFGEMKIQRGNYTVDIELKMVALRSWEAIATCDNAKGMGTGASSDIAASRAVLFLLRAMSEETEEVANKEQVKEQVFDPTHWVNYGHHEGHKCMTLSVMSETPSGKKFWVRYDDGTEGEERERFLRPIKKEGK